MTYIQKIAQLKQLDDNAKKREMKKEDRAAMDEARGKSCRA